MPAWRASSSSAASAAGISCPRCALCPRHPTPTLPPSTAPDGGATGVEYDGAGSAPRLHPFAKAPDPSPIGLHMLSDEVTRLRVRRPAVRKSWLEHGPGGHPERRGQEPFVELPWDEALDVVAKELARVKTTWSNRAGWLPGPCSSQL